MAIVQRSQRPDSSSNYSSVAVLLLLNILCFQLGRNYESLQREVGEMAGASSLLSSVTSSKSTFTIQKPHVADSPLQPPPGEAQNLPAIRVEQDTTDIQRKIYGGKGDGKHLGGWTNIDIHGISPYLWRHMMTQFGIKSILDVGCGRGISTSWFLFNGMDALCLEGSHDAYLNSVLPDRDTQMVEHDFSRGPYWPAKTYDAVWCVEFSEHVGRNFQQNYLPAFRKAAMIFMTHSRFGGWHHVETHDDDWWTRKFELYGFKYMHEMTVEVREVARQEAMHGEKAVNGEDANPQNLYTMLVFFNPAVGALPQHAHLFSEPGCYEGVKDGKVVTRECGPGKDKMKHLEETPLAKEFHPLPVLPENQRKWEEHIRKHIKQGNTAT